jgi:hypothetical protein
MTAIYAAMLKKPFAPQARSALRVLTPKTARSASIAHPGQPAMDLVPTQKDRLLIARRELGHPRAPSVRPTARHLSAARATGATMAMAQFPAKASAQQDSSATSKHYQVAFNEWLKQFVRRDISAHPTLPAQPSVRLELGQPQVASRLTNAHLAKTAIVV